MRRFSIVNPTCTPYQFHWESADEPQGGKRLSEFRILQREGAISPGKKTEVRTAT